jgi:hypothetical protein
MAIACSRVSSGDKENRQRNEGAAQEEVALERPGSAWMSRDVAVD